MLGRNATSGTASPRARQSPRGSYTQWLYAAPGARTCRSLFTSLALFGMFRRHENTHESTLLRNVRNAVFAATRSRKFRFPINSVLAKQRKPLSRKKDARQCARSDHPRRDCNCVWKHHMGLNNALRRLQPPWSIILLRDHLHGLLMDRRFSLL